MDLQYQILQLPGPGVVISHEQSHIRTDLCDLWNILHHATKGSDYTIGKIYPKVAETPFVTVHLHNDKF